MTVIKGFIWALVTSVLMFSVFAFWLIGTNSGLRWAAGLAPDMLTVASIDGDLSDFSFDQLELNIDGSTIQIAQGSLQWRPFALLSRQASIDNLRVTGVDVELAETEPTTTPYSPWKGLELPIDVSVNRAVINYLSISSLVKSSVTPSALLAVSKIELSGSVENSILELKELKLSSVDKRALLSGKINISASPEGVIDLSHTLNWPIDEMNLESSGSLKGTWSSLLIQHDQLSPLSARLTATIENALSQRIEWSADVVTAARGEQILMGETVDLASGEFKLSGYFLPAQGLQGLTADIVGQTSLASDNYSQWSAIADLSLFSDDLTIRKLSLSQQVQKKPAELSLSGQVSHLSRFLEQTTTSLDEQGQVDVNAVWSSLSWPLAPGVERSTADVIADGQLSITGSSQRYAVLANATGKAYDQNLNAELKMVLAGKLLEIEKLTILSGKSRLSAKGKIDDRMDLSWSIVSPDVGDFLAQGSGPLASTGKLTGPAAKPKVTLVADSKSLSYAGFSIEDLALSAEVSLASANDPLKVSLQTSSILQDQSTIADRLAINVDGRVKSHSISLESTLANKATLSLNAEGSLVKDEWSAMLSTFNLSDPLLADWKLNNEVAVKVASDVFSVSESCLINKSQSLCFAANSNSQITNVTASLTALDLANLNRFVQLYDLNIQGQVNGEFLYKKQPQQTSAIIDGYLESESTVLTWQQSGDDELYDEMLVFESIRASIKQVDRLRGSIEVSLANADVATFEIAVDDAIDSPTFMQAQVAGQGKLAIADLSVLPTVLLEAVSLNGSLNADLELKGSLAAPEIVASGELKNAQAKIPELGLQLEGLELQVTSDGTSKVDMNGQLRSGSGELLLNGNVDFLNIQTPKVTLVLSGKSLTLSDTPELNIIGDIDLIVKLENELLDLRGGVVIARAELDFKLPESAILVSDDVVLKGQEEQISSFKQRLRITVDLGNKTKIRAQGLDANLLGKLLVFQEPGGILRGEGQITVNDGRYRAYGQDLKIDKGRLVFDGGSIDDPSLDLKAEKTVDSITAGVSVTGRASAPRLNLYSTPSMQDEDILSVLIFNKPVGNLGSQDGFTLLRIANSLRGDGTNDVTKMTEKLQQSLGLTNLELQLTNNAPSLVAGKQLSSKFYVGYGYGLLDAAQSLILRYNLSEAWSLKADLGVDSGADLRYQIER
jgi:translocation and assembly module TamB